MAALPRRGKNTIARTAWLALPLFLLLLLLVLLATPAHSRQHQGLTSTTSAQEGIELFLIDLSPVSPMSIRFPVGLFLRKDLVVSDAPIGLAREWN